jgi:2-polyprenyl-3-methyl-5-hydroxy-6-metoxy-1,4-benzoquinol methylase
MTYVVDNSLKFDFCPLCNSQEISKIGDINYFYPISYVSNIINLTITPELWNCNNCNSIFTQNIIPENQSIKLYSMGEKVWSPYKFETHKTELVIKKLSQLLKKDLHVLDIGCDSGSFLDFAQEKGCKTFGVEYSQNSLKILKQKGHVGYSTIDDAEGLFDVITAFDVIEHIYNVPSFIDKCLSKLSPNGYLVFLTGNPSSLPAKVTKSNWWYMRCPEHIVCPSHEYFTMHSQVKLFDWIPTFAGKAHQRRIVNSVKFILKELLKFNFSGLHWSVPDHALIILQSVQTSHNPLSEEIPENQLTNIG